MNRDDDMEGFSLLSLVFPLWFRLMMVFQTV